MSPGSVLIRDYGSCRNEGNCQLSAVRERVLEVKGSRDANGSSDRLIDWRVVDVDRRARRTRSTTDWQQRLCFYCCCCCTESQTTTTDPNARQALAVAGARERRDTQQRSGRRRAQNAARATMRTCARPAAHATRERAIRAGIKGTYSR